MNNGTREACRKASSKSELMDTIRLNLRLDGQEIALERIGHHQRGLKI